MNWLPLPEFECQKCDFASLKTILTWLSLNSQRPWQGYGRPTTGVVSSRVLYIPSRSVKSQNVPMKEKQEAGMITVPPYLGLIPSFFKRFDVWLYFTKWNPVIVPNTPWISHKQPLKSPLLNIPQLHTRWRDSTPPTTFRPMSWKPLTTLQNKKNAIRLLLGNSFWDGRVL